MKKLNKKGYIMVETLIVTIFVVTLFIFIYRVTVPAMGTYEQLNNYDDIDSVYYTNLFKQLVTRYANTDYLDEYLETNSYIDASDCTNTNIYKAPEYCELIKKKISIGDNDKVFLTLYNVSEFKKEVKDNDYFDSGSLSNFRDYMNTVSNVESFYEDIKDMNYVGKYRLFIVRNIKEGDLSKGRRYSNIGIYTGTFDKYLMGEKVKVDVGDGTGEKEFYVLKNSPSTEADIELMLAENFTDSSVCFNSTGTSVEPNLVLDKLKTITNNWDNTLFYTNYNYESASGYTINYNGYHARLLEEKDILEFLGCKEDDKTCFDPTEAFQVTFDQEKLSFLVNGLADETGYWTGIVLPNSDLYAWSIKNGIVSPTLLSDCTNIGIRPIIKVEKEYVSRVNEE